MTHLYGLVVGVVVLLLHYLGAVGSTVPQTGVLDGKGYYDRVWFLDTVNHLLSGISLFWLWYWVGGVIPIGNLQAAYAVTMVVELAIVWEVYEKYSWREDENHKSTRLYWEDTTLDIASVVLGAIIAYFMVPYL